MVVEMLEIECARDSMDWCVVASEVVCILVQDPHLWSDLPSQAGPPGQKD